MIFENSRKQDLSGDRLSRRNYPVTQRLDGMKRPLPVGLDLDMTEQPTNQEYPRRDLPPPHPFFKSVGWWRVPIWGAACGACGGFAVGINITYVPVLFFGYDVAWIIRSVQFAWLGAAFGFVCGLIASAGKIAQTLTGDED
jgi:hypothetical protein